MEKLTLLKTWLSMELEKLGIDCSKLYARHLLDIFFNSDTYTNDLQLIKREQTIFSFANDSSKKNNGKSGGGTMKAWKGGDLSSQSSSFPISSSNQPPPNTQLPTNHDDWKKQEALRCLLRASHDDALQNNDLVDKLKKIIEKLHLSVVEFTEIKKEKLKKKPKENYNQAFPNSLNFLPMQTIDICNTAWKNYQISKQKETAGLKPTFSHSKSKHEISLKRLKTHISPAANKGSNNSHRFSTRERRHPYVKQKESNNKQNIHNHKRHYKSKSELKNQSKKKATSTKKSSLAKHYFTRSTKISFHNKSEQTKNSFKKSNPSSSGDRWSLNKKFTEKLQLNTPESIKLNNENYELFNFEKRSSLKKNSNDIITEDDLSSLFKNKLRRNDENNNFYDVEDNPRSPTSFQTSKKYVYPNHNLCYKKEINPCEKKVDSYSSKSGPEYEVMSHYYLPESISKELNSVSDCTNVRQDNSIVTSGISKWYRDLTTGILNFVPAENSSLLSSKFCNDKDQYWKSCPSPSLWDNEYDTKSVDSGSISGRVSKIKTIFSNFNNISVSSSTKTESIWDNTNSILNEVKHDQNTVGASGDHAEEKSNVSNIFYCTNVKLDSNLNPFTSKSNKHLLNLENSYYSHDQNTTYSSASEDTTSINKKCSSLVENSWVNGTLTMPDKENIWSNPNDCGVFGSFLYKHQSTPYILESNKNVSSNLFNDCKIPIEKNNFDTLRSSHLNNSSKVKASEPWSSLVTYNKQADKFNYDFNPEVCGTIKENFYEYSSKTNIWNQDSVCSAFTNEHLRSSASSSMIDFESCWLDESAMSNDKTMNSFYSSAQDNSNNLSSFTEIKQPKLHESKVSRHSNKELNLSSLNEKENDPYYSNIKAIHDYGSSLRENDSCNNDQRDYILKLIVNSVFEDETEKSNFPSVKNAAESKEANVWDYSVYDSKKEEFYEQQREDRKDINELLSLINSSVLHMNNLTLSEEPLTKVKSAQLQEPSIPYSESKHQWRRNDITKELNNYVQSYIVDSSCNESPKYHPNINANFNNEINWMSAFYPSTLSNCYNSTLDNSFSTSMDINNSTSIWHANQTTKEIWKPTIKKNIDYKSYEDKFIPVPFVESEANRKITIPDWFDIEMVMRDHQNINVEGVNFSCARCWSYDNIELEVSEIMQTKLDKYIVSCNCNNSKDKEHEMPALKHLIKELKHHLEAPPLPQPSLHNKQKQLTDKSTQTSPQQQLSLPEQQTWLATTSFEQQIRLIDRSLQSELSIRPHKPNSR